MKILLLNVALIDQMDPSFVSFGILSIASYLNQHNLADAVIDDINYDYSNLVGTEEIVVNFLNRVMVNIEDTSFDLIGISCQFSTAFANVCRVAACIKQIEPTLPIVIGGMHPTIYQDVILRKYPDLFDFIILGEGEISFAHLVCAIQTDQNYNKIDGIVYRDQSGQIIVSKKNQYISNLDELLLPDYSILKLDKLKIDTTSWYNPKKLPIQFPFPIFASRSCSHRCNFCSAAFVHGRGTRYRSIQLVVDEIKMLHEEYGATYFKFMDDNIAQDTTYAVGLSNAIVRNNLNIQIDLTGGVSSRGLVPETVDALVAAGTIRIFLAIESGSEYIRNRVMKKGLTTKDIYRAVDACARHSSLYLSSFFIIGMPQETQKTLNETWEMLNMLPLDGYGIFFATPYPGTGLYEYCRQYNLLEYSDDDFVELPNLFHRNDSNCIPHFSPHQLSKLDLIEFRNRAMALLANKRTQSEVKPGWPLPR